MLRKLCCRCRDVVHAINVEFRPHIFWHVGIQFIEKMHAFHQYCSLPGVVGAVDGTHFEIRKPSINPEDYFYFKSSCYTIQCQVVVDISWKFIDVSVDMSGSTHDIQVSKRSALYHKAVHENLFDPVFSHVGFCLIGDNGYPLLPWLMTPHRELPNAA